MNIILVQENISIEYETFTVVSLNLKTRPIKNDLSNVFIGIGSVCVRARVRS